ncbi:DUF3822 family protein [Tenacibaculum sp. UWU-22]|uniref:DUF3822 family protein n=1 Tax=Tenacibaculum sp. UWU-22 TaxID=3234187 RepID=UPI0034DAF353
MIKKSKNSELKAEHKNISIQFSLDGFSFCITEATSNKPINVTQYQFKNKVETPELLLEKIEHIFTSDSTLQQDFKNVVVIHQNNLATLVPSKYFDENNLKTYLNYTIKTLANDFIAFDDCTKISAKNVYIPYVNINNYLFQNFGEFEYKHHATVLIDKLINLAATKDQQHFFVYVSASQLDIVVTQGSDLVFYNSFLFNTKEDFIYYILFTAEQLALDPNKFNLTFLGDISENSAIYKITHTYIRNIDFIKINTDFFKSDTELSPYSNYLLLS